MKEEKLYFSIKEASHILGVTYAHLHHLENEINELHIFRTPTGRRLYHSEQIELLKKIIFLTKEKGISIQTAGKWVLDSQSNHARILNTIKGLQNTKSFLEILKSKIEENQKG